MQMRAKDIWLHVSTSSVDLPFSDNDRDRS